MSLDYFQLIDRMKIDTPIIKRDYIKIYHQQRVQLNNPDQDIEFFVGENDNYHHLGKVIPSIGYNL